MQKKYQSFWKLEKFYLPEEKKSKLNTQYTEPFPFLEYTLEKKKKKKKSCNTIYWIDYPALEDLLIHLLSPDPAITVVLYRDVEELKKKIPVHFAVGHKGGKRTDNFKPMIRSQVRVLKTFELNVVFDHSF